MTTRDLGDGAPPGVRSTHRRYRYVFGAVALIVIFGGGGYALGATVASGNASPSARAGARTVPAHDVRVAQGLVSSIDRTHNSFVVAGRGTAGATTVRVTESTIFSSFTGVETFADLSTGSAVVVYGVPRTTPRVHTAIAERVVIGVDNRFAGRPPGSGRFGGLPGFANLATSGTITSIDPSDNRFTVRTRVGAQVIVDVDSSTSYQSITGSSPGGISSLVVGERALVSGTTTSDKTVHATAVLVVPPDAFGPGGFGGARSGANSGVG